MRGKAVARRIRGVRRRSWERAARRRPLHSAAAAAHACLPPPSVLQDSAIGGTMAADNDGELFDLVDEQDRVIGREMRSVVHRKGGERGRG